MDALGRSDDELGGARPELLAERLRVWAQPLCWTPSLTSEAMYDRIDVLLPPAVLEALGVSVERVDRPDPGLRFSLAKGGPTRIQLEAHFGEGHELPWLHPDSRRTIAFLVGEPGAPFEVSVFAYFPSPGLPTMGALSVVMRPHAPQPAWIQRKPRDPTADPAACPDCGTINAPEVKFCTRCSRFLEW